MAPLKPSSLAVRSSSSAAASGTAVGNAAKAAKRCGLAGDGGVQAVVDAAGERSGGFGRQFLRRRRAVRDHLHVDADVVHLLDADAGEIVQALALLARPCRLRCRVGLGQFLVPIMLLDGDDRTMRLTEHVSSRDAARTAERRARVLAISAPTAL